MRLSILLFSLAAFFSTLFFFASNVYSSEVEDRIHELQDKIDELQQAENTLSKQINILNSNIDLTSLRIDNIKAAIDKLSKEIEDLLLEIDRLEVQLTRRSELLLVRIPESYKRSVSSKFWILLFSRNFSDFLSRIKYISYVQERDAELLFTLKATQNNFQDRKSLREEKKQKQVQLSRELNIEIAELDSQKQDKQALLTQTKNDEQVYQQLLAQALAEREALERAIVEGVQVGPINKGDPIALVGNTGYPGCSTGPHLHFEVRSGGSWVNPRSYLSPSGDWDWPIDGDINITQEYGKTEYSWRYAYSGGIHTGIDMVGSSSVIKAPKDGTLYSSSQVCGGSSVIKIKYIDHGGGLMSFYLHVQ